MAGIFPVSTTPSLGRYLRDPRARLDIAPTDTALIQAIAEQVRNIPGPILQVGASHPALTQALALPGRTLAVVEGDRQRAAAVANCNPGVKVIICHISSAPHALRDLGLGTVKGVAAGKCLDNTRTDDLEKAIQAISRCLEQGGKWIQPSYSQTSPVPVHLLEKYGLVETQGGRVANQVPAAYLFYFSKS